MSEEQISLQLHQFKTHGFGGAFIHPRPGLITEYLSDMWFSLWGYALKTAKELGLTLNIYDENTYPSGFGGGHVSTLLPDCLAQGMSYALIDLEKDIANNQSISDMLGAPVIAAYSCLEVDGSIEILEDITTWPVSQWADDAEKVFVIVYLAPSVEGWYAGCAYTDLLRPEVCQAFLQTTHDAYRRHFGADFGGSIQAVFSDEPQISARRSYGDTPALPFSYWFVNEFERMNGYSLLKNLPCVLKNVKGGLFDYPAEKIRYDYYKTIHALWTQNFIAPIGKWCAEHHLNWTGHYVEHRWPHLAIGTSPSIQSYYEYHQWPAMDMLSTTCLRESATHPLIFAIQEIRSAANQFGKERTLCELYGAGGWDSTFEDYKRMADWVLVNGINYITPHLTLATIAGARKRDHPQSFDWREPWWEQYTHINDYIGRACRMLSQGMMSQRILVLNPSTTGYLIPYEDEDGLLSAQSSADAMKNPDMHHFLEMVQLLTDAQWDYDFGDEFTIQRHGMVDSRQLKIARQSYDIVLISEDMKNKLASTADLLDKFMCAGGTVIAVGCPGKYIEGLWDESVYARLEMMWEQCSLSVLDARLARSLPRRIRSDRPFLPGFAHMCRMLPDGRKILFFVNHSFTPYRGNITVEGDKVCEYRLFEGDAISCAYTTCNGEVTFPVSLVRNQSAMYIVGEKADRIISKAVPQKKIPVKLKCIEREHSNMLLVDYCDIVIGNRQMKDLNVIRASEIIFSERGFRKNPWDNKVQYKNSVMDRNTLYDEGSGFSATYLFHVADGFIPEVIEVIAERPSHCRIRVNGVDVPWISGRHELDHQFGVADAAALVQNGENSVEVIVDCFDVRMETEAIYIFGEFGVQSQNDHWVLVPQRALSYGAWISQGMPFYPYAVRYAYVFTLEAQPDAVLLDLNDYEATAVSAFINGNEVLLHVDGRRKVDISTWVHTGENELVIRVCGSLKNLLGPHFLRQPARGSAWPAMWKHAAVGRRAPTSYDLIAYGLNAEPCLWTATV